MMTRQFKYFLLLTLLIFSTQVNAFDKKRSGFLLGVGIGLHDTDMDDNGVPNPDIAINESETGYATSLRIGGGVNEQVLLYFANDTNWYKERINNEQTTLGLSGFGISYYFSPKTNTPYLTAIVGVANRAQIFSSTDAQDYRGTGYSIGVGYEFSTWLGFQLDYMRLDLEHTESRQYTKDASAFRLTFQTNFY